MASHQPKPDLDPAIGAIESVLQAERAAAQRLEDCRRRAESLLASTRGQAQEIMRRADARISRVHTSYLQKLQDEIADLTPVQATANRHVSEATLRAAAARLAAKLTGDAW
jgi:vacuolar-type H+-ATPase subunit H